MNVTRPKVFATGAVVLALAGGAVAGREIFSSNAASTTASERYGVLQAQARAKPKPHVVPYLGPFARIRKYGKVCGPEVRLMEGALRNTTPPVRKTKAQTCIGDATVKQLRAFQKRHGLPPSGIYGLRTHRALAHAYTAEQRSDLLYIAHLIVVRKERAAVLIVAGHVRLVGSRMGYTQSGSRANFGHWPDVPQNTDCSGFATWVMWQAGVGFRVGYFGPGSPVGWTGTLGRQGKHVSIRQGLAVGDLVLYGGGFPYGHVAVYIGHGLVISHGSPGIKVLPLNYRPVSEVRRMIF
jgi:cell wall-associated NlpC family hydrolase